MGKTLAQLITNARQLSNTQKSRFVTDDELGDYVNRAVRVLYDLITAADESYYNTLIDLTFGNLTEAAANLPLPPDFGKVRGMTRFPDSLQACPVYSKTFTNHQVGEVGYLLDGNNIAIAPFQLASNGPFRLTYVQKPPQFGPAINIQTNSDSVTSGGLWTFANLGGSGNGGTGPGGYLGATLIVSGTSQFANSGAFPITGISPTTLTTAGGLANETFAAPVQASIAFPAITPTYPTVAPYQAASMTQLDVTLDNFDDFISNWSALRIVEKKKDTESAQTIGAMLEAITQRVNAMAPDRSAEPQQAPVLWSPTGYPYRGIFPYSPGGGFGN